jgi:hypothetical protein
MYLRAGYATLFSRFIKCRIIFGFKSVSWSKVMSIIRERLEKVNYSYTIGFISSSIFNIDHSILQTCHDSDIQIAINGEDLDKNEKHKTDVENYKQTINQLLDNFERYFI